ncbi:hypothetical protein HMPREF0758_0018 [Serratia odorifera DSM 4582]|uniref:Uncharacterized protein n=1 Tax=Serratia odorifera DSM 4582 TaxID=667129 RepID=D4DVR8_SEROD|nr:hypothetical protein HMPREF0758_0018 [Serratia odorifera DSM 4582]
MKSARWLREVPRYLMANVNISWSTRYDDEVQRKMPVIDKVQ